MLFFFSLNQRFDLTSDSLIILIHQFRLSTVAQMYSKLRFKQRHQKDLITDIFSDRRVSVGKESGHTADVLHEDVFVCSFGIVFIMTRIRHFLRPLPAQILLVLQFLLIQDGYKRSFLQCSLRIPLRLRRTSRESRRR